MISGLPAFSASPAASISRRGSGIASNTQGDRPATGIGGEIGDQVGDIDVAAVARGEQVAEHHAALDGLERREAEPARLADEADGTIMRAHGGHAAFGQGHVGIGQCRAAEEVDRAQAVRADDPDARLGGDGGQTILLGLALVARDLAIAGGEDDRAFRACVGSIPDDALHRDTRHRDDHGVGRLRQRGDGRKAGAGADLLIARIDQIDAPGEAELLELTDGACTRRGRCRRCTHDRDALGIERSGQIRVGIQGACAWRHSVRSGLPGIDRAVLPGARRCQRASIGRLPTFCRLQCKVRPPSTASAAPVT